MLKTNGDPGVAAPDGGFQIIYGCPGCGNRATVTTQYQNRSGQPHIVPAAKFRCTNCHDHPHMTELSCKHIEASRIVQPMMVPPKDIAGAKS